MVGWGPCDSVKGGSTTNVIDIGGTQVPGDTEIVDPSKLIYDEVSNVVSGALETILTFVVPVVPIIHLLTVDFGGCNIGRYFLYWGAALQAKKTLWFNGSGLDGKWDFRKNRAGGLEVPPNTIVTVKVQHSRPLPSDHYAYIHYMEIR